MKKSNLTPDIGIEIVQQTEKSMGMNWREIIDEGIVSKNIFIKDSKDGSKFICNNLIIIPFSEYDQEGNRPLAIVNLKLLKYIKHELFEVNVYEKTNNDESAYMLYLGCYVETPATLFQF